MILLLDLEVLLENVQYCQVIPKMEKLMNITVRRNFGAM